MTDFLRTAGGLRHGEFLDDCGAELARCVASVRETGKQATLTIQLTVKPASKGQNALILSDKVRAKLPELPVGETIMFANDDNVLSLNDPRQVEMNLRVAPGQDTTPLRNAG